MAIQGPLNSFSEQDKRLIRLLERLLMECSNEPTSSNIPLGTVPLSDDEARELTVRIDYTLESKEFWQTAHLIDSLSRGRREDARAVYLAGRARHGFSRIMSSSHYHFFLARLGFERPQFRNIDEMDYEYFVRMEKRLFLRLGINPEIVRLLERFLWSHVDGVNAARQGKHIIKDGLLVHTLKTIRPQEDLRGGNVSGVWSTNRVAGALTLFANMTVMFTTRDWTVTGTMSAMAGALGLIVIG